MTYSREATTLAVRLFLRLLADGEVTPADRTLFRSFQDPEVRAVIQDVLEPEAHVILFATDQAIYLTPAVDNDLFGYRNDELRDAMALQNNTQLYTAYFAILCLLAAFYNSDDQRQATREFLAVEALEKMISDHLSTVLAADEAAVKALEVQTELTLGSVAAYWDGLDIYDDTLKQLTRGRKNRVSFLLRIGAFLAREGLAEVLDHREIRLLPKLQHLIGHYYFHEQRKDQLLQLLQRPLPLNGSAEASDRATP
ncbi:MAG: hypothetical protein H7338_14120 [Candidatus Sericytochromatia bacterium]|nr:hypothetical protein [Candidatus Sericytochromatia bacterium]